MAYKTRINIEIRNYNRLFRLLRENHYQVKTDQIGFVVTGNGIKVPLIVHWDGSHIRVRNPGVAATLTPEQRKNVKRHSAAIQKILQKATPRSRPRSWRRIQDESDRNHPAVFRILVLVLRQLGFSYRRLNANTLVVPDTQDGILYHPVFHSENDRNYLIGFTGNNVQTDRRRAMDDRVQFALLSQFAGGFPTRGEAEHGYTYYERLPYSEHLGRQGRGGWSVQPSDLDRASQEFAVRLVGGSAGEGLQGRRGEDANDVEERRAEAPNNEVAASDNRESADERRQQEDFDRLRQEYAYDFIREEVIEKRMFQVIEEERTPDGTIRVRLRV